MESAPESATETADNTARLEMNRLISLGGVEIRAVNFGVRQGDASTSARIVSEDVRDGIDRLVAVGDVFQIGDLNVRIVAVSEASLRLEVVA